MSTIKTVSSRIFIDTTQEEVFNAVTDWNSQGKWILATKTRGVGSNSHKLGGKIEAFTGIGRFGFLDTMTITKWNPPEQCEVTHTGKVVKGYGLFEVGQENGQTYFAWTEYTQLPFGRIGAVAWPVIAPLVKLGLTFSLRRFKKYSNF